QCREAYHWPESELQKQKYSSGSDIQFSEMGLTSIHRTAQLPTGLVVIHECCADQFSTYQTMLSVFLKQTSYVKQWEVVLDEFYRGPLPC
ncbi:MAG TPA: hypothetical protein V6C65_29060, partial [Allocoleopsis sp.]